MGTQQQGQVAVRAHLPGHGQGGGGGEGVNVVHRMGVVGHGPGKAHGHGDTAHDGGVGEVVAQAAEELLDHHNGDEGAHNGHPPGEGGGHIEGQQHAGDHGGEVAGGVLPVHELAVAPLKEDAGHHGHSHQDQGVDAEDDHRGDQGGEQRQAHPLHDLLGGVGAGDMGGRGYDQLIVVHHFLPPFFMRIFARAMEGARGRLAGQTKEQVPQLMHRSALSSWSCSTSPFS